MTCEEALEKAVECLNKYADDDELAGSNGSGCYSNPWIVVKEWLKEIRKLQKD